MKLKLEWGTGGDLALSCPAWEDVLRSQSGGRGNDDEICLSFMPNNTCGHRKEHIQMERGLALWGQKNKTETGFALRRFRGGFDRWDQEKPEDKLAPGDTLQIERSIWKGASSILCA